MASGTSNTSTIDVATSYAGIANTFSSANTLAADSDNMESLLQSLQLQFQAKAALNILKSEIELHGNLVNGIVDDFLKR